MRPHALVLLTLLLCLAPTVPAQEKSGSNAEDTVRRAQELLDLSVRQNSESHALALQTAQQALVLWQAAGDRDGIARTYAQIARCFLVQSDLMEATKTYEQVLQLWRELNNTKQEASTLIKLGFIEVRKGEWSAAIALLTQAQNLVDEEDVTQMGQIAVGLATIFNESGLPENGLIQLRRALDYYRQTPDERDDKRMVLELGNTYYLLGNPIEALAYLTQALASFDPDTLDAAQCHEYLGRVYGSLGEHAIALQHLQSAVPIYERIGNPQEAAQARGLMGKTYQQQGKLELARRYYQQALVTFRALSDQLNQSAIHYALGRLELKRGNYDAAENYLRQSIAETENLRRVSTSRDLTAAFSATVHERYSGYIECLMHKHQAKPSQGLDVLAFELSELARARSLAELLRTTQTNLVPGLDPELAKQEKLLRQSLKVKEDSRVTLLALDHPKEELQALDAELARLEREYEQVTDIIRAQYPSYRQVTRPDTWDLQQIQEHVVADDQTVLLEYSLGADRSYVWAVTHNSIKSYELPTQARINEAAQKVYQLLTTTHAARSGDELSQATRELGQMVLSPVAAELNKRRMIVVADGALHYIPFQILPASSASDQPLVAATEVINAPSASILGQLRQEKTRRQAPEKLIAAFGDPVFASNYAQRKDSTASQSIASTQPVENERWRHALRDIETSGDAFDPANIQPLFHTNRELANLRNAAGAETFMATGFDASREQLEKLDLAKYAILHFATHGILDPKRPENSGFFLSMINRERQDVNGFIRLQDVYALHAPVDLVVLSACRTGLGKDVRGEGLIGLTRGFMYAGASSVVASLWKVDDEATAELMKHFYSNMLQHGMTPAAALRQAQNTIRQQPHWRSPYFWAAFTLQGDYDQVIRSPHTSASKRYLPVVLVVSLLALLAGAGWWYRRRHMSRTS